MAFPVVSGTPTYSGVFIPEIWSSKLVEKYYDQTVLAQVSNTDYEGEIKNQGDKVIIRSIPTLEIQDYSVGQTLVNQRPVGTKQELYRLMRTLADEGKAILFYSTDYAELIGCCDRVSVLYDGAVVAELEGAAITEEALVAAALNIGAAA
mgnify:CR=1 FL=1